MGLAASQARMLLLGTRKSDLEYRGQMICQARLKLATDTEAVAKEYSDAISNRVIMLKSTSGNVDLTLANLSTLGFSLVDKAGNAVNGVNSQQIEDGLRLGQYQVRNINTNQNIAWSADSHFDDQLDTSDDAVAESTYSVKSAELQTRDKALELELKNVDTQHTAVQTEIDAVKKVIEKNIESTFKTFG